MKTPQFPVTDDHIHIDPRNGRGLAAAKDFLRSGGTHMFLVSKPASSFNIIPSCGEDFIEVFDETLTVAAQIRTLGLKVYPVLGVHPAELSRLCQDFPLPRVKEIMKDGLSRAASYVKAGTAVALKSGRPHYEVPPEHLAASNEILAHAFLHAADLGCAVQVHAESGPCADMIDLANNAGLDPSRVVKHYATEDTPLIPSFIATHPGIPAHARQLRSFTLESDYMDENSRPGAVIGPKSVPRVTRKLLDDGHLTLEDVYRIHADTPMKVYGVEIAL